MNRALIRDFLLSKKLSSGGFTFIEILIVLGILSVLATLSFNAFTRFNRAQVLESAVNNVVSVLEEARSRTLSSEGDTVFGVHFATSTSRVTLFQGTNYSSSSSSNKITTFSRLVTIATTTFETGGMDVVFERLTGKTMASGTIELLLMTEPPKTKTVVVEESGVSYERQ